MTNWAFLGRSLSVAVAAVFGVLFLLAVLAGVLLGPPEPLLIPPALDLATTAATRTASASAVAGGSPFELFPTPFAF